MNPVIKHKPIGFSPVELMLLALLAFLLGLGLWQALRGSKPTREPLY